MITGTILGTETVLMNLGLKGESVKIELRQAVGLMTLELLRTVKMKLSDDVLRVRTGRLRRSINQKIEDDAFGIFGTVGTNVVYARRLEEGFSGDESVRAHLRTITQAFGKSLVGGPLTIQVKPFTRHANTPARSFLRSSLDELSPHIVKALQEAVHKGIE